MRVYGAVHRECQTARKYWQARVGGYGWGPVDYWRVQSRCAHMRVYREVYVWVKSCEPRQKSVEQANSHG